ncbi:MAG: serine/threonine-protein kinase [Pyrinomonadaceae bacterium]
MGAGGMGEVYLAHDLNLMSRLVALKILPAEVSKDKERLQRLIHEARAASVTNHPNIAHIYEIEVTNEISFIVMEYIQGETLRERLRKERLKVTEAIDIAIQVASALVAVHASRIAHRDIKPENIILHPEGYIKVLDFGLAKSTGVLLPTSDPLSSTIAGTLTAPGVLVGTIAYMSPEQIRGVPIDERTDIWSFGVVLCEMICGRPTFGGPSTGDLIASILERDVTSITHFSPECPELLEWIICKCLTKNREERYQTAKELLIDLRRLKHRLEVDPESTHSTRLRARLFRKASSRRISHSSKVPLSLGDAVVSLSPASGVEMIKGQKQPGASRSKI